MPAITIDLPYPVSTNAIWRSNRGRVHKSPKYESWLKEAKLLWMVQRPKLKVRRIEGPYILTIVVCEPKDKRQRDLPNYEKCCSDVCVELGIIEQDSLIRELHMKWGSEKDAPYGARLMFQNVT